MDHLGKSNEARNTLFAAQQIAQSSRLPIEEAKLLERLARGYYSCGDYRLAMQSMAIHNVEHAMKVLGAIKRLGVRVAIDDFGTGYSSLSQLKHFPIDTLKLDRCFAQDLPAHAEDQAITRAIIWARSLI